MSSRKSSEGEEGKPTLPAAAMAVGGSFRYTVWDPWMILSQMATLQCYFYAALGAWVFTWDLLAGQYPRSLDQAGHFVALFAEKFPNEFCFKTSPKERPKSLSLKRCSSTRRSC